MSGKNQIILNLVLLSSLLGIALSVTFNCRLYSALDDFALSEVSKRQFKSYYIYLQVIEYLDMVNGCLLVLGVALVNLPKGL